LYDFLEKYSKKQQKAVELSNYNGTFLIRFIFELHAHKLKELIFYTTKKLKINMGEHNYLVVTSTLPITVMLGFGLYVNLVVVE